MGVNYAVNPHLVDFAEYPWLYVSPTNCTFGSTVATATCPNSDGTAVP